MGGRIPDIGNEKVSNLSNRAIKKNTSSSASRVLDMQGFVELFCSNAWLHLHIPRSVHALNTWAILQFTGTEQLRLNI